MKGIIRYVLATIIVVAFSFGFYELIIHAGAANTFFFSIVAVGVIAVIKLVAIILEEWI